MIKFGNPSEYNASELAEFVALVEKYENIPNVNYLKHGVAHAHLILREFRDDKLVGVAAVKVPSIEHIRGYAAEFGLTAAKGKAHLDPLLDRIQADESMPALAWELFAAQASLQVSLEQQRAINFHILQCALIQTCFKERQEHGAMER